MSKKEINRVHDILDAISSDGNVEVVDIPGCYFVYLKKEKFMCVVRKDLDEKKISCN